MAMEPINAIFATSPPELSEASVSKGALQKKLISTSFVEGGEEKKVENNTPLPTDRYEHGCREEKTGYSELARYRRIEKVEKYPSDVPLGVPSPISVYSAIEGLASRLENNIETPPENLSVLIDLYNRLVDKLENSSY
ncbi:MAG: hypothetical protein LBD73_03155 [Deferribacteraceae bacterium]|nr:hypothetical protein [Deferribacteraceae bacterium]